MSNRFETFVIGAILMFGLLFTVGEQQSHADSVLTDAQQRLLADSRYVYISSQRKGGNFGAPAEIWFLFHDDAVWVGTTPESWRVRRIRKGRPDAKIAISKVDGPSFKAKGAIVKDPKVEELMFTTFANKYPEGWPKHEQKFRDGFKDGSRILIKYTPVSDF